MSKEDLIDKVEAMASIVREKEAICMNNKGAVNVMMEHLAETNENLFQFFRVK